MVSRIVVAGLVLILPSTAPLPVPVGTWCAAAPKTHVVARGVRLLLFKGVLRVVTASRVIDYHLVRPCPLRMCFHSSILVDPTRVRHRVDRPAGRRRRASLQLGLPYAWPFPGRVPS